MENKREWGEGFSQDAKKRKGGKEVWRIYGGFLCEICVRGLVI